MRLRPLKTEDAPLMLEWMHDRNVTEFLAANFSGKSLEDAENFIRSSWQEENNIHLAIASENDEYMGTVSLKDIDKKQKTAEFAISTRSIAHGKGYAWFGMSQILEYGRKDLGLERIFWYVSRKNLRAMRFYDKHGFREWKADGQNPEYKYYRI